MKPALSFLLFSFLSINIWAQNSWNILINPANTTVELNQTFSVSIFVQHVSGTLNGVDAYVNFNPTYLEVVVPLTPDPSASAAAITGLPFESVGAPSSDGFNNNAVHNNTLGQVDHGRFRTGAAGHPSASFILFTVTFRAKAIPPGPGTTSITFNTTGVRTTNAVEGLDPDALDGITPGTVTITAPSGCIPIGAASIGNSPAQPCDAQPFNLILANVTGGLSPFDVVVDGVTYPNILEGGIITPITLPTYNIFDLVGDVPAVPQNNDDAIEGPGGIEVGTRFTSSVNGFIRGIRLYNGFPSPTGTYTGKLYANDGGVVDPNDDDDKGVPLASANFAPFSGAGWKQVLFANPIPITANTVYVATYYSSAGNYAKTNNYFQTFGHTNSNGTLTAPVSGLDAEPNGNANGLYTYGGNTEVGKPLAPGFPTRTFMGGGYFVDVLFSPATTSYTFTSITGDDGCNLSGSQVLNVTSVDCSTLPVSLLNFSATPQGNKITLKWATASEDNNRGFDILRSTDGVNWTTIGFVAGAGNSSFTKNYSYIDGNLTARRYYYKLKQIDFDERYKYSAIVSATLNGKGEYSLRQNYPNPTNGETTIQFTLPKTEKVNLSLFDVSGRVVKVIVNSSKDEGTHAIPVNVGSLTRGIYYYKIQAGDFTDVKKLTIQ
jgi:hypothetical protein